MKTSYRIYFGEKLFVIINAADDSYAALKERPGTILLDHPGNVLLKKSIEDLDNDLADAVVVLAENTNETLDWFTSNFKIIQAGGGLVKNERDEYLFIFRRGKWDLPKGKLDKGETIAACALREVKEETGLRKITLGEHLCNTWHVYREKGRLVLKESVWYHMDCAGNQKLTPQTEEDITEIKWIAPDQWQSITGNTFPSIKDVLQASGLLKERSFN